VKPAALVTGASSGIGALYADRFARRGIPPLPDAGRREAFQAARLAMPPNFRQIHAAERYRREVTA
jgi:short-subunit dehydrogenase